MIQLEQGKLNCSLVDLAKYPQAGAVSALVDEIKFGADENQVRAPTQHGLSSNTMALITSDCGAMCSPPHQMALL